MDPSILQKLQKSLASLIRDKVLGLSKNGNEVLDLSFVAPNSEFVAELGNKPVINCYLVGINEDKVRRRSDPMRRAYNESKTHFILQKEPRYVDISYMLTVWSKDKQGMAEIEHLILGYLICGLGDFDFMPEDILTRHKVDMAPQGIRFSLFGSEHSDKISGQVWQAMGSTPKPCLMLSLSVPVSVHLPEHLPATHSLERELNRIK